MEAAVMALCLVIGMVSVMVLVTVIVVLIKQLSALENKLMARDYTEYAAQNRAKGKPSTNFLKEQIERAARRNDDNDDESNA